MTATKANQFFSVLAMRARLYDRFGQAAEMELVFRALGPRLPWVKRQSRGAWSRHVGKGALL
jgi:hypothetical protein